MLREERSSREDLKKLSLGLQSFDDGVGPQKYTTTPILASMKLALSISALAASTIAYGISMAAPAAAQTGAVTQKVNLEKVCHEDVCVEVQVEQSVNPSGNDNGYPQVQETVCMEDAPCETLEYPEDEIPVYQEYPSAYPVAEPISYEGGDTFICGSDDYGWPTTYVKSPGQSMPLIHWVSEYFSGSGYDPLTRCEQVTERFNRFYEEGRLNFITTGFVNRQPVVCVSGYIGGPCTDVLFTLKPGQDAAQAVQQLFDVRVGLDGPLYESGSRVYFDLNDRLNQLSGK